MVSTPCITLLTDLGTTDAYAGIVKGLLYKDAPDARLVDLTHAADRDSLYASAYMLATAYPYFASGTVHLVLTDPGSSPKQRILVAETDSQYLVAPDDGIATLLFLQHPPKKLVALENKRFLLAAQRHTFHSRVIYAPVASALATGATSLEELGSDAGDWKRLPHALAAVGSGGQIRGEVVHIDGLGNVITNIRATQLPDGPVRIAIGDAVMDRICDTYAEVEPGKVLAIIGTTGNLEICINQGNASERLFITLSQRVAVTSG